MQPAIPCRRERRTMVVNEQDERGDPLRHMCETCAGASRAAADRLFAKQIDKARYRCESGPRALSSARRAAVAVTRDRPSYALSADK